MSITKMIYMPLRDDWGVICLYLALKIQMSIEGEKGQNGRKGNEFHEVRLGIDLLSYFHAACALLQDFEIFDAFERLIIIWSI